MSPTQPPSPAESHSWASVALTGAWMALFAGCMASIVSVAGSYAGVLRFAITCAGCAAVLLALALWRGSRLVRILAVAGLIPLLFIVGEFLRRT